jgi:acetate---CoA ligase (ADP-forming)
VTDRSSSLQPFFTPQGVAVIGASRDPSKLSYGVIRNLVDPDTGYPGPIYPINPKADEILGLRCYPHISAVPEPVELAVLIIPASAVSAAVEDCGKRGIRAAVVISGGFREVGAEGAAREREMVAVAERYGMRVMGPNGIGVIDTYTPLNTTFVKGMPPRGHIAFLSQSGALCGGVIDWTIGQGIGFSRFLSLGNEADVNETDVLGFLAGDDNSKVIALYLEDVKGGPAFVNALRGAARKKPVIALKAGRTGSGQAATASHTGALAGAHSAFRAACKQAGALEVESIQALFDAALAFAYQPLPAGNRIAIVTNAGGPAALAADTLEPAGLQLARSSAETVLRLRPVVAADAQLAGPVDLLGGADEHGYRAAMDAVLADPDCDGVLAVLVPQVLVDPVAVVRAFGAAAEAQGQGGSANRKPVVACLMGDVSLDEAVATAHRLRIPAYTFPEDAVRAFGALWQRGAIEERLAAQPVTEVSDAERASRARGRRKAQDVLTLAHAAGKRALDAAEALPLLEAYGIRAPQSYLALDPADAVEFADRIGYPVALKIMSPDILHKSDIGGVIVGAEDAAAVREGFEAILARAKAAHPEARIRGIQVQEMVRGGQEVIVGIKRDPTFGPLVMFGLGGIYVEALADVSFRIAPLTEADAEAMIDEVRSAKLLRGLRGAAPADRGALVDAIVRIGRLAADHEEIIELDVNPLLALPSGVAAVDARAILAA